MALVAVGVVYVALGVVFTSKVLNWIVGPVWFAVWLSVLAPRIGGERS
jgi:hypothetical protein